MYASPKRSVLFSGLLHAAAIILVLIATRVPPSTIHRAVRSVLLLPRDIDASAPMVLRPQVGGGGGGAGAPMPASRGRLPRPSLRQFTPPQVEALNESPRLTMEPTILVSPDVVLPKVDLAQYGIPNGALGPLSGGPGTNAGIGNGKGGGVGDSIGPGYGDGPGGGGVTAAPLRGRGSMRPPELLYKTEPEYSDDARKAKVQGKVVLLIEVDARGAARNIRVTESLGLGLDERAASAVAQWRFRPALRNGAPVAAPVLVEVLFRLL
jgi:periplasmic protein TonB